jgi:predicted RNA binding protein YcfA (HicA-like mRNA interferase family)
LTDGINSDTIFLTEEGSTDNIDGIIRQMEKNPTNIGFVDLSKVCNHYFGEPRTKGSHHTYKTPWQGDPRINIQNENGKAKAYQIRQVLKAIDRLEK